VTRPQKAATGALESQIKLIWWLQQKSRLESVAIYGKSQSLKSQCQNEAPGYGVKSILRNRGPVRDQANYSTQSSYGTYYSCCCEQHIFQTLDSSWCGAVSMSSIHGSV